MNMDENSQEKALPADSANQVLPEESGTEQPTAEMSKAPTVPDVIVPHKTKLLPNCKITGIDYQASLADALRELKKYKIVNIGIDPEKKNGLPFELHWDPDHCEISCHPEQAGEFEVNLYVDVTMHERHIFPFKVTVNPDPKTLWKDIPSDQNGVYAKPDSDKMFLACGENLSIAAASRRGRSHAQEGKPRDDDFIAAWNAETGCAILITADGAGSAKFSRKGAEIATRTALEKVKAAVTPDFWTTLEPALMKWNDSKDPQAGKNIQAALYKVLPSAAWEAKVQIKKESQEHEARYLADYKKTEKFTPRDYATTLIMTIAKKREAGNWFVSTFWIGDGGQGVYRPDAGEVIIQGKPDCGEFGGEARFLTEDSTEVWPQDANKLIERRLYFTIVDSFKAIVLMTDGVTDPKFETDNNLLSLTKWNEFWEDLVKEVPFEKRDPSVADALLKWMDFWSPGNHDDRTMMILY